MSKLRNFERNDYNANCVVRILPGMNREVTRWYVFAGPKLPNVRPRKVILVKKENLGHRLQMADTTSRLLVLSEAPKSELGDLAGFCAGRKLYGCPEPFTSGDRVICAAEMRAPPFALAFQPDQKRQSGLLVPDFAFDIQVVSRIADFFAVDLAERPELPFPLQLLRHDAVAERRVVHHLFPRMSGKVDHQGRNLIANRRRSVIGHHVVSRRWYQDGMRAHAPAGERDFLMILPLDGGRF